MTQNTRYCFWKQILAQILIPRNRIGLFINAISIAPIGQIALAMNTNSELTVHLKKFFFHYRNFGLRETRVFLRRLSFCCNWHLQWLQILYCYYGSYEPEGRILILPNCSFRDYYILVFDSSFWSENRLRWTQWRKSTSKTFLWQSTQRCNRSKWVRRTHVSSENWTFGNIGLEYQTFFAWTRRIFFLHFLLFLTTWFLRRDIRMFYPLFT